MITSTCYLLHFAEPIGNPADPLGQARHYLGSSAGLDDELARLRGPRCHAAIMREVNRRGIDWQLARTWPGDRGRERRLKDMGGARRLCPECGADPPWYMRGETMIGGYSIVAGMINRRFNPEPPIDRRQVSAWFQRGTRNQAGNPPPQPVRKVSKPPRTTVRFLFDTEHWVEWFRPGVPGPRNKGWRVYPELAEPLTGPPPKRTGRPHSRHLIESGLQPTRELSPAGPAPVAQPERNGRGASLKEVQCGFDSRRGHAQHQRPSGDDHVRQGPQGRGSETCGQGCGQGCPPGRPRGQESCRN